MRHEHQAEHHHLQAFDASCSRGIVLRSCNLSESSGPGQIRTLVVARATVEADQPDP